MNELITKIEITKKQLIHEVNNDMCHNWYYLVYARCFINDKQFYRFRFVIWFDCDEVCEFFDKDSVSKKEISDYANEIAGNSAYGFEGKKVRDFKGFCSNTIADYNR